MYNFIKVTLLNVKDYDVVYMAIIRTDQILSVIEIDGIVNLVTVGAEPQPIKESMDYIVTKLGAL